MSGIEDIADSGSGLSVSRSDVSNKLKQNLMLQNGRRLPLSSKVTAENQEFFEAIESLPFNNMGDAIDGIFLKTGRHTLLEDLA